MKRFRGTLRNDDYVSRQLKHHGIVLKHSQKTYLRCLMMEHVHNLKQAGLMLSDVDFEDLAGEYKAHLAIELAPRVLKVKELW